MTEANVSVQRARKKKAWKSRLALIGTLGLALIAAACVSIAIIVGWKLTHPERKPINDSPANYGLDYRDIQFPSRDGKVNLKGWFLPGKVVAGRVPMTVIFAHGYRGNRLEAKLPALELAQALVERGYNVLMFDFRNSGESEGTLTSVGQFEKYDLLGAADWVGANTDEGKIAVIGFSMGAATAILAAAEEGKIAGVVADSPFKNLLEYLQVNLPHWSHLPNFPFTPLILNLLPMLTGTSPEEVDPYSAADRVYPRPILFIHSAGDEAIPYTESEAMWQKHPDRFRFWKTEGAGHVGSYAKQPEAYIQKVTQFLENLR